MTILIANIGTSDLAVRLEQPLKKLPSDRLNEVSLSDRDLEQDYFLPIGFDRNEPNLERNLNEKEGVVWDNREYLIANLLCKPFDINYEQDTRNPNIYHLSFRDLTHRILQEYQQDSDHWHDRLRPGRMAGVIETGVERFDVKQVYIFVTDQPPKQPNGKDNPGYKTDSIHLFELLQAWFKREYGDHIELIAETLPRNIPAIDLDLLLEEYYKFFNRCTEDSILISVKGGTPQMMTALRAQAIASGVEKQLFISPELDLKSLLEGKPSVCKLTPNWRNLKLQKYQTIKLLLDRWDFYGANEILTEWANTLKDLGNKGTLNWSTIHEHEQMVAQTSQGLQIALAAFNFDLEGARNLKNNLSEQDRNLPWIQQVTDQSQYDSALNLYTQCRIYWELGQAANFLARLGSFYEEVLHQIFIKLDADRFFNQNYKPVWSLQIQKLKTDGLDISNQFKKIDSTFKKAVENGYQFLKLLNRKQKINFAQALIVTSYPSNSEFKQYWHSVEESLVELDYWYEKRNSVVHGSKGISIERLDEILKFDRKNPPTNREATDPETACDGQEILPTMANIYRHLDRILKTDRSATYVVGPEKQEDSARYYIYSDAVDWVKKQLDSLT